MAVGLLSPALPHFTARRLFPSIPSSEMSKRIFFRADPQMHALNGIFQTIYRKAAANARHIHQLSFAASLPRPVCFQV